MTVKVCSKCNIKKHKEDFIKDKKCKDGRRNVCKRCHTDYMIEYYKTKEDKRNAKNKMNTKFVPSWKRHHLTEEEYLKIFNKFNGKCHVCKVNDGTSIDHDHSCCSKNRSCGKCVRGILCRSCNTALGSLKEDKDIIYNLIKYIEPR